MYDIEITILTFGLTQLPVLATQPPSLSHVSRQWKQPSTIIPRNALKCHKLVRVIASGDGGILL